MFNHNILALRSFLLHDQYLFLYFKKKKNLFNLGTLEKISQRTKEIKYFILTLLFLKINLVG